MRTLETSDRAFLEVPTYFRACCWDVATRHVTASYAHPAYQLCRGLLHHCPYDLEEEEWEQEVQELLAVAEAGDDEAVLAWFRQWFPRCMALVPRRRRESFLAGVYRAVADDLV